jgi:hypothetical protein
MTYPPLPEPLDSEEEIFDETVVVYVDDLLILQRHPEILAMQLFTAVLKEPVTPSSYAMLSSVLTLHASPEAVQVDSGDSIGGWLFLDFEVPELPRPRLAS